MAGTLQFDLVSPERRLASMAATEVQIPGAEGDMTAMEGHAPVITTLRAGVLKAVGAEGTKSYVVTGGFAEITGTGFQLVFRTWGDTRVARVRADWTAIGPVKDDDDWDVA